MPPPSRKRRAPSEEAGPAATQSRAHQRRGAVSDDEADDDDDEQTQSRAAEGLEQLSKSLVRYALACEYSRTPIKRQDVNQKVLGSQTRMFRHVFDSANSQLMDIFGMRLVELPSRDKVTIRQKRAAAASDVQVKSSGMWILQNILPEQYRTPDIIGPGREPAESVPDVDAAYTGLYTMIVALVMLSGGQLSEAKLDRFLRRMNAEQSTPVDTKEKLLARMIKDGYIIKIKDSASGEEMIDYVVGPRGKVEVGKDGVASFVKTVYGNGVDDLEQRLSRSLGIVEDIDAPVAEAPIRGPGRPRRRGSEDD